MTKGIGRCIWTGMALVALTGCGRRDFGAGCKKASALTSPWTELNLPVQDKRTRVCESTADRLKIRSFAWKGEGESATAFAGALAASGYTKDRCSGAACYYKGDGHVVSVQPMDFAAKRGAVTVVLNRRRDVTVKR